jgi:Uma2 family endonuclease
VTLADSEPEPDLAVVRESPNGYTASHPGPADIGLVIEVSNTTLDSDRDDKIPLYARDSVGMYWIVNLIDRQVEVYEQPSGPTSSPTYGTRRTYKPGDAIPFALAGATVGSVLVNDLLP